MFVEHQIIFSIYLFIGLMFYEHLLAIRGIIIYHSFVFYEDSDKL